MSSAQTVNNMSEILPDLVVCSNDGSTWRSIEVVKFNHTFDKLSVPAAVKHKITLNLTDSRHVVARIGDDLHQKRIDREAVTLIPATQPSEWRHLANAASNILQLYLQPALLREVAASIDIDPDKVKLVVQLGVQDPQVEHITLALLAELEAGCPSGRLYGESAATMLATHLLKHYSVCENTIREHKSGIPQKTLRRILDYMNDNFGENLSLSELAAIANLSPYHFTRQFKQATNLSPSQFLLKLRLEKAEILLQNPKLSIANIALQTGFSNQSHFTRVFKSHFGFTPLKLRRFL